MSLFTKYLTWPIFRKPEPVIPTQWGPVSPHMRRQAAENMRLNPELREKVEKLIGPEKARRNFPEAYRH